MKLSGTAARVSPVTRPATPSASSSLPDIWLLWGECCSVPYLLPPQRNLWTPEAKTAEAS